MEERANNYFVTEDKIEEILIQSWEKVMRVENVKINDNYFELGGDFYKAVQITAYLKEFQLEVDVEDLLRNPQISRLINFVKPCEVKKASLNVENSTDGAPALPRYSAVSENKFAELKKYVESVAGIGAEIKDIYPLTPVQERMFMHYFFFKESKANFLQYSFTINGKLDVDMFEESFNIVIQRNDIFRTIFTSRRLTRPLQIVLKERRTKVNYEDISDLSIDDKESYINKVKKSDGEKGFNLAKDILTRMSILKTSECSYEVIWSFHHILLDGWSIEIVCNEILMAYKEQRTNQENTMGEVQPITKYISWLESRNREEAIGFWKRYLNDYKQNLTLRKLGNEVNEGQYKREEVIFSLGLDLSVELRKFAKQTKVVIDIVFQAIWGIILQKYSKTNDAVFLTVVSGRPSEISGIEKMVGFFVNMNPVRVKCDDDTTFSSLVNCIHQDLIEAKKYEYLPIKEIRENTETNMDLMDNVVIFESYPLDEEVSNLTQNGYYEFSIQKKEAYQQTGFDFNFVIIPNNEYKIALNYNGMIYSMEFIQTLKNDIYKIIDSITKNSDVLIKDLKK